MLYKPWSCSRDKLTKLIATPSRTRSRTQPTNPVSNDSVHTPDGTFLWYTARPPNPNMIPVCKCKWLESPVHAINSFWVKLKNKCYCVYLDENNNIVYIYFFLNKFINFQNVSIDKQALVKTYRKVSSDIIGYSRSNFITSTLILKYSCLT